MKKSVWDSLEKNDLIVGVKLKETELHSFQSPAERPAKGSYKLYPENKITSSIPFKKSEDFSMESIQTNIHELFTNKGTIKTESSACDIVYECPVGSKSAESLKRSFSYPHIDSFKSKNSIW